MSQQEGTGMPTRSRDRFAEAVKSSVLSGSIAGAVAAFTTRQSIRVEAFGYRDLASSSPMERDTIFRMASTAKPVFAAAALILLDEGRFQLDDAISKWIPELSNRRVLRLPASELDDTVPARREITIFDVLTFQLGIGIYLKPHDTPIMRAMMARGVGPVIESVPFGPEEFIMRLGSLPLAHQPGETFMYHTGDDVLRVLISRAANQPLGEFLQERIFAPLGMVDSGLSVPESKRDRFATCYFPQNSPGERLSVWDDADGRFAQDPIFPNSIVSSMADYIRFFDMLLNAGEFRGRRLLKPESIALMTTDHLSQEQKSRSPAPEGFWQIRGWGMGATVYAKSVPFGPNAGSYSWFGGCGPHFVVDKTRGSSTILMMQRNVQGDEQTKLGYEFELNTYRDFLSQ